MTHGGLGDLLSTKEILVFCGSGGVGKTSVAASAGLAAATHRDAKVLVLTIDPARRLADALGLDGQLGNTERRVPPEKLKLAGIEAKGELWAAMLDTKQSWDALVLRHAPDTETAYKILENRLYHNITARFVQSHDYIAMERLYELHNSGDWDLIVVDTPPTRNAIDFLDAPARMAEFFGGRFVRWLTMPYRVSGKRGARMFTMASKPFYQVADRILGGELLQDVAEFFLNFQTMQEGFVTRAKSVEELLHERRTAFTVVTTLEAAPLHEAQRFIEELTTRDFPLGALVLNKTLPPILRDADAARAAESMVDRAPELASMLEADGGLDGADAASITRVLKSVGESFANFSMVATREAELRSELGSSGPGVLVEVPELDGEVTDLDALLQIGARLYPS
jgi:anion-transporting  ArsA/GET3 family ATPase